MVRQDWVGRLLLSRFNVVAGGSSGIQSLPVSFREYNSEACGSILENSPLLGLDGPDPIVETWPLYPRRSGGVRSELEDLFCFLARIPSFGTDATRIPQDISARTRIDLSRAQYV